MSRKFVAARRTPLMEPHTIYRLPSYPPATASKEGEELFSRVTLVWKLADRWLARRRPFNQKFQISTDVFIFGASNVMSNG